jgi:hypothetical protein
VIFGSDPRTTNDTDFQSLPPDPEEAVRSTSKSSQGPIRLAIEAATTGEVVVKGTDIVIFWESLDGQSVQEGSTLDVQRAFNTPFFSSKTSPTFNDPINDISNEESLVQTHREGVERSRSKLQVNLFTAPRLVRDEKVTMILLPSGENFDPWIKGGGKTSSTPFTINTSPAGYTTL